MLRFPCFDEALFGAYMSGTNAYVLYLNTPLWCIKQPWGSLEPHVAAKAWMPAGLDTGDTACVLCCGPLKVTGRTARAPYHSARIAGS